MAGDAANVLPKSFSMVGGDGDHSYAKNSSSQRMILDIAKEMIQESVIDKLDLKCLGFDGSTALRTFRIADLGSSVGPNTFIAVQNIIEAVETKNYKSEGCSLEFQVFFNDHSENDFNTLFKSLPTSRNYFAAGVPGSFYRRLFPESSLHFVHSSTAMHWLSKVPQEITDPRSPAWNKGRIHWVGLVKQVNEAYSGQFKNDMEAFLNARAEEVVPGGLMALITSLQPDGANTIDSNMGPFTDFLQSTLLEMVGKGLIEQEKLDSFNVPLYIPTSEELKGAIARNGCFRIERMDKMPDPPNMLDLTLTPQTVSSGIRAVFEGLVKEHFGSELVDKIFGCLSTNVAENFVHEIIKHRDHNNKAANAFVLLKRVVD